MASRYSVSIIPCTTQFSKHFISCHVIVLPFCGTASNAPSPLFLFRRLLSMLSNKMLYTTNREFSIQILWLITTLNVCHFQAFRNVSKFVSAKQRCVVCVCVCASQLVWRRRTKTASKPFLYSLWICMMNLSYALAHHAMRLRLFHFHTQRTYTICTLDGIALCLWNVSSLMSHAKMHMNFESTLCTQRHQFLFRMRMWLFSGAYARMSGEFSRRHDRSGSTSAKRNAVISHFPSNSLCCKLHTTQP